MALEAEPCSGAPGARRVCVADALVRAVTRQFVGWLARSADVVN
jgi:hypothetical protein